MGIDKARQIYEDLGVVPVINASGYQTVIGGSRVGTEVQAAMDIANRYFADMEELLKKPVHSSPTPSAQKRRWSHPDARRLLPSAQPPACRAATPKKWNNYPTPRA